MSTTPLGMGTRVRAAALFDRLFDDAAIFPPGNAPMALAVPAYATSRASADAARIGAFVCSAGRLDELREALPEGSRLPLALVVPGGADDLAPALAVVASDARLQLCGVELPAGDAGVARTLAAVDAAVPPDVPAYVELRFDAHVDHYVGTVATAAHRVKLRTGGTTAEAVPSSAALAVALVACGRRDVRFKLTAGLHSAVRHRDPVTGFEHHGFLNVQAALDSAVHGGSVAEVVAWLEEHDVATVQHWARAVDVERACLVRERFVGFGACSTADPLCELRALGLLPDGAS